jgi:serine phosphatase RsbU (regulator of sigma subunit)
MTEMGPNIIAWTRPSGENAGLQRGDKILSINGKSYMSFAQMDALIDYQIGHVNEYRIERDGNILIVPVTTSELGLRNVIIQSGIYWMLGMIFFGIGILVFLMKPYHGPSWTFLIMVSTLGIVITYFAPSYFYKPPILENVSIFFLPLFPATVLNLTVLFPQRRAYFADRKFCIIIPYGISLVLGIYARTFSSDISYVPGFVLNTIYFYILSSLVMFLGSTIYSYRKSQVIAVRLQSLVIFAGITVALFIPTIELLYNIFFKSSLFPQQVFFYLFFLIFFPLSIGYAIARHNLFEIDVFIRRTYGYVLSTSSVIGIYAVIISILNNAFQGSEISRSPLFSITFALFVVFFFRPIHERIQKFVDRVFYRQRYDYRKTIKDISETMISILDPKQIHNILIGSVVREMFLENGLLFLPEPAGKVYQVQTAEGIDKKGLASRHLTKDDLLLKIMEKKHDALFRFAVDLDPQYQDDREVLQHTFREFSSELMIPLKYKDEMLGIVSFGGKKSGKMFTAEDIDLLKTIINQSAIALENAKLFEENIEKSRMEEELKIAHDIQISMLPEKAPSIEGFAIAAKSIPAREVGGDFYDFIEIGENGADRKIGIVVGDVSGKAVSGALVMAASRSIFRVLAEFHTSVRDVMSIGNLRLKQDIKKGMFVALVYAVLDPRQKTMTLANAGQTQPILCKNDQHEPAHIDTTGDKFPMGIIKDCDYQETQMPLRQGDTIVFYTDGIVEAVNDKDELYGFDRFITSIREARGLEADSLLSKLMDDVLNFVGNVEQHDDITLVVVKVE